MDDNANALRELLARERIRDRIVQVARGEDRRDAISLAGCFWPDATCDFGIFSGGFAAYLDWVGPGSPAVPVTQHMLGQSLIVLEGETAKAETHVLAYHRVAAGEARDVVIGGRYLDRLERRAGAWRIARRVMLYDWSQDVGASVDWAQGLMGMAFSAGHFTGRAAGDHSESFFAEP